MNIRHLVPGYWEHFRCGIQFHCTGAERNHRGSQGKIARFESADIAQQFCLGVILIKDRMTQKLRFTLKAASNDFNRLVADGGGIEIENRQQHRDVLHCLVEREADGMIVEFAKVDAIGHGALRR